MGKKGMFASLSASRAPPGVDHQAQRPSGSGPFKTLGHSNSCGCEQRNHQHNLPGGLFLP